LLFDLLSLFDHQVGSMVLVQCDSLQDTVFHAGVVGVHLLDEELPDVLLVESI
jgi:hypothetical protein